MVHQKVIQAIQVQGVVFRDWHGNILALAAQRPEKGTNNEAEVQAALLAVEWGLKLGFKNLHLEGDSLIIINAIIKGET